MPVPELTAVLVVRDEAARLPGCLAALRPLVAAIVVLDTGSRDGTVRLAAEAGATVLHTHWDGDFARARNLALSHARTRWLLSVDADELACGDPDGLDRLLSGAGAGAGVGVGPGLDGFGVEVHNPYPGADRDAHVHRPIRLFRRGAVRWEGALHERLQRPDGSPLRLQPCPAEVLALRHGGYRDPATVRAKALRNAELARAELAALAGSGRVDLTAPAGSAGADPVATPTVAPASALRELPDPAAARAWYDLGRSLLAADDLAGAIPALGRSVEAASGGPPALQARDFLVRAHLAAGDWPAARAELDRLRGGGADPGYRDWLAARILLGEGRPAQALDLLRGVPALVDTLGCDLGLGLVLEARALAAALAGQRDEAIACLLLAMLGFGRVEGRGPELLRLWGDRPAEGLVGLLAQAAADSSAALAPVLAELSGCPEPGPTVAGGLQAAGGPIPAKG